MQFWLSRTITVVILSTVLSLNAARFNGKQLAWLDTTSPSKVVDFERKVHSHGFAYHFIAGGLGFVEILVVLEVVSWGVRRVSSQRRPTADAAQDKTAECQG